MLVRSLLGASLAAGLLVVLSGCGNYTVTFELEQVINAWTGADNSRMPLEVDIVCLTKAEAEKHPELVNRRVTSDKWFSSRRGDSQFDIAPDHIFSLRSGDSDRWGDRLIGPSLLSPIDSDKNRVAYRVKHSDCLSSGSAVLIFAAFRDGSDSGYAKTRPVVIAPAPRGNTELLISVGKKSIALRKTE